MIKKIIFILAIISLIVLAGCKKEEPFPTELSNVNPDKAVGNVIKNTELSDCAALKTEAQRVACIETLEGR